MSRQHPVSTETALLGSHLCWSSCVRLAHPEELQPKGLQHTHPFVPINPGKQPPTPCKKYVVFILQVREEMDSNFLCSFSAVPC